jgi:hypothetical protein
MQQKEDDDETLVIDLSNLRHVVGSAVVKWIYTDDLPFSSSSSTDPDEIGFARDLMSAAGVLRLTDLVSRYADVFSFFLSFFFCTVASYFSLASSSRNE